MKKRSQYIADFLNFIEQAKLDYLHSAEALETEQKRQEDLLHDIEFCMDSRERSKLATQLHRCRLERRRLKDIQEETSIIYNFVTEPANKKVLDKIASQLLGSLRKSESYHENRFYRRRLKEGEKAND